MKTKVMFWTIFIVAFISTALVLSETFALFENETDYVTNIDSGAWIVKISNVDISSGTAQNITVDAFNYTSNPRVTENKIAPGGSAYFDLVVDATSCDVAVLYDINFLFNQVNYADNVSITVTEVGGSLTTKTGPNKYTGIIDLDRIEAGQKVTLRVTVNWQDVVGYEENDTALGMDEESGLVVPISVTARQYLGESLSTYSE